MQINEKVLVETSGDDNTKALIPHRIFWRNRGYLVEKIGLHHTYWRGRERVHVFSVIADETFFRLEFGTESLVWVLAEVE